MATLYEALTGLKGAREAIRKTAVENLDILPADKNSWGPTWTWWMPIGENTGYGRPSSPYVVNTNMS